MKFIKLKSDIDIDEILNEFNFYRAQEKHNIITSWFTPYCDSRVGIHVYIKDNFVYGYYENGNTSISGKSLGRIKSWFFIMLRRRNNVTLVNGVVIGDIILSAFCYALICLEILKCLNNTVKDNMADLFGSLFFGGLFLFLLSKEKTILFDNIKNIFKNK